jgi:hypothetical protein
MSGRQTIGSARRPKSMPRTYLLMHYAECSATYGEVDVNTLHVMGEIGRQRRAHAIAHHSWTP